MDFYDLLFAKSLSGGGSSVEVEPLSVTENGTYEETGKAYSPITVNVSGGSSGLTLGDSLRLSPGSASWVASSYNYVFVDPGSSNYKNRRSLWCNGNIHPKIYYTDKYDTFNDNLSVIEIPNGSTKVKLTINMTCYVKFLELNIENGVPTGEITSSSYLNITGGTELSYNLNSSSKGLVASFKVNDSNTDFGAPSLAPNNTIYSAKLEFE